MTDEHRHEQERSEPASLRERLAALEHLQWAHWTKYMLDKLEHVLGGEVSGFDELADVIHWRDQIATPYGMLTEKEKDSDREWADKVLALISQEEPMMILPDGWIERAQELMAEVGIELPWAPTPQPETTSNLEATFTVTAGAAASNAATPVVLKFDDGVDGT